VASTSDKSSSSEQSSSDQQARPPAPPQLTPATSLPVGWEFGEVRPAPKTTPTPAPSLGPLAAFVGDWHGRGFNTIFRPDSPRTPTPLPHPVSGSDNVLELNLTSESLSFSPSLGTVPNRGMVQADAFLNGVPYLQAINDVTTGQSTGIHLEPGLWVIVPLTTDPAEGPTLVRMASIPHGTTINAQGTFETFSGAPKIAPVDITPFVEGNPSSKIRFRSQTADDATTPRIPQDLCRHSRCARRSPYQSRGRSRSPRRRFNIRRGSSSTSTA